MRSVKNQAQLNSHILAFQKDTDHYHRHDDKRSEGNPGEQQAMRGISLAVDGVERAVIGRIFSEEPVTADFVRVQAYGGA